jgi:hypothetical protein
MSSRSIGVMKLSTRARPILSEATRSRWRASLKASSATLRDGSLSISYSALVLSCAATAASSSRLKNCLPDPKMVWRENMAVPRVAKRWQGYGGIMTVS